MHEDRQRGSSKKNAFRPPPPSVQTVPVAMRKSFWPPGTGSGCARHFPRCGDRALRRPRESSLKEPPRVGSKPQRREEESGSILVREGRRNATCEAGAARSVRLRHGRGRRRGRRLTGCRGRRSRGEGGGNRRVSKAQYRAELPDQVDVRSE